MLACSTTCVTCHAFGAVQLKKGTTAANKTYTVKEVAAHNVPEDAWIIINNKVRTGNGHSSSWWGRWGRQAVFLLWRPLEDCSTCKSLSSGHCLRRCTMCRHG